LAWLIAFLTLITFLTASLPSLAQEDIEEAAENRLWLPQLSFPPSDPTKEAGHLPLWGRDISFSYLGTNWYLSKKRGLELTFDNNDFYLRAGGRIYMDLTHYNDDKNDLGRDGFGIRTALLELTGRFTEGWQYRLSFGGLTEGGRFDGSDIFIDDAYLAIIKEETAWSWVSSENRSAWRAKPAPWPPRSWSELYRTHWFPVPPLESATTWPESVGESTGGG
jgi:hypothetical protein